MGKDWIKTAYKNSIQMMSVSLLSQTLYVVTTCAGFNRKCGEFMTSDNDMKAAENNYAGFLSFLKIGTILTALVTILVVFLIS